MPAKRVAVLKLDMNGRFAVNTVDNLLIVHHQASKTSAVFDIRWAGDYDGAISLHHPVLAALPISPVTIPAQETKGMDDGGIGVPLRSGDHARLSCVGMCPVYGHVTRCTHPPFVNECVLDVKVCSRRGSAAHSPIIIVFFPHTVGPQLMGLFLLISHPKINSEEDEVMGSRVT